MKRLAGLDIVRGVGILCVVFLHSATFHYEAITEVDFDNPPLVITIIGFLRFFVRLLDRCSDNLGSRNLSRSRHFVGSIPVNFGQSVRRANFAFTHC